MSQGRSGSFWESSYLHMSRQLLLQILSPSQSHISSVQTQMVKTPPNQPMSAQIPHGCIYWGGWVNAPNTPHLARYFSEVELSRKKGAQAPRVHPHSLHPRGRHHHPDGKPSFTTDRKRGDSILQPPHLTHRGPTSLCCSFPQPKLFHEFDLNFLNSLGVMNMVFLTSLVFAKKTNEKRNK